MTQILRREDETPKCINLLSSITSVGFARKECSYAESTPTPISHVTIHHNAFPLSAWNWDKQPCA
jgi:hypothetical protein